MDKPSKPSEGSKRSRYIRIGKSKVERSDTYEDAITKLVKRTQRGVKQVKKQVVKPTTVITTIPEEKEGDNAEKQNFLSKIRSRIDNVLWQPILLKLESRQERKRAEEIGWTRQKFREVVESEVYKGIDKWMLTLFSIGAPIVLEWSSQRLSQQNIPNIDADLIKIITSYTEGAIGTALAGDTLLNTGAYGTDYWYSIEKDPRDKTGERRELSTKIEPLMNSLGTMGSFITAASAFQLARIARLPKLVRLSKLAKVSRLANKIISSATNSLGDESFAKINEQISKSFFNLIIIAGAWLSFHNIPETPMIATFAVGLEVHTLSTRSRAILRNILTDRFEDEERKLEEFLDSKPILSMIADIFRNLKSDNEIKSNANKLAIALDEISGLANPAGIKIRVDERGKVIPKRIKAAVMTYDLRNSTILTTIYKEKDVDPEMIRYFSELDEILEKHGGYINFAGDGVMSFFEDKVDEDGATVKCGETKAIECAVEMWQFCEKMNHVFQNKFPVEDSQSDHSTGFGMSSADEITFANYLGERDRGEKSVMRPIQARGAAINYSARYADVAKKHTNHFFFTSQDEINNLPQELADKFECLGEHQMKGVDTTIMWAIKKPESPSEEITV